MVAADPRVGLDVGGPLKDWRARRLCPLCSGKIVRGPYEMCQAGHTSELALIDLTQPLSKTERRQVERGYWNRWLLSGLGLLGLVVGAVVMLLANNDLIAQPVSWIVEPIAFGLGMCAIIFGPPVLATPNREQIQRQLRAAEPPADW